MNIFKKLLIKRPFNSGLDWVIDKAEDEKHNKNIVTNYLLFVALIIFFVFKLIEDPIYYFFINNDNQD